jgi:hypothetical protein
VAQEVNQQYRQRLKSFLVLDMLQRSQDQLNNNIRGNLLSMIGTADQSEEYLLNLYHLQ